MYQGAPNYFFQQQKTYKSNQHHDVEYEQLQKIGQGAEGIVYKGINQKTKEIVAIKIQQRMSQNEKEVTTKLLKSNFQHIIKIYEVIEQYSEVIVIMEFANGEFYHKLTHPSFPKLDRKVKHQLFFQIVEGVRELHSLDLIHRDMKPENVVYFEQQGGGMILKLCDFGLVKLIKESLAVTKNIGTPYYQAPELLYQNNIEYTNKVDVWALGMMWFEILYGSNLLDCIFLFYLGRTVQEQQDLIRNISDAEIHKRLDDSKVFKEEWENFIIKNILRKNPNERLTSAKLSEYLKECLATGNLPKQQQQQVVVTQSKIIKNIQFQQNPLPFKSVFPPQQVNSFPQFQNFQNNQIKPQTNTNFIKFQPQQQQIVNQNQVKQIDQAQLNLELEEQKKQFEERIKREKEEELKQKLKEAEEEAARKHQKELEEKEKNLIEQRQLKEKEIENMQAEKQEQQQKMLDLQIKYNNELDEFKKKQQREEEQRIKEKEDQLKQQMQEQLQKEMQAKENQLKKQIEKELLEQKNKEYNEQLKLKEQEQLKQQQQLFQENKGIVVNLINISLDLLSNYSKSLQQKISDSLMGPEFTQYIQQANEYIKELSDETTSVQQDLQAVSNLQFDQNINQTIASYLTKYQQFSTNFGVYQNEKSSNLAQIYSQIMNRKSMQQEEKARQFQLIQQEQEKQIKELKEELNTKLEKLSKINQQFIQKVQQYEQVKTIYEQYDKSDQLNSIIKESKQQLNYFYQLNFDFAIQTQGIQQDNQSLIQSLKYNIEKLNKQDQIFKGLEIQLDNFIKIQIQIEQELQYKKKKTIEDCQEQIDFQIQTYEQFINQGNQQSQQVQNLIKVLCDTINVLQQIKQELTSIQTTFNSTTINNELQLINQKQIQSQQCYAQLQKIKGQLDNVLAYEGLLNQLNQQKKILIELNKQKVNEQIQTIQQQIDIISQLMIQCKFNIDKSGINQKIQHLQQIKLDSNRRFEEIIMIQEFKSQQEFEQFKQAIEKFVQKNQEIVKAEEVSVRDLKNSFQLLMQKEQSESQQLLSKAQILYEQILHNIKDYQKQYDSFENFPQIQQLQDYQQEQTLLREELTKLQEMQQDGINDQDILKKIVLKQEKSTTTNKNSIEILTKFQNQLKVNQQLLDERLRYFNSIHIPQIFQQDFTFQQNKFKQEQSQIEQFVNQLNISFSQLKTQTNENLKVQSNQFIQNYQRWDKQIIEGQLAQWKIFNEQLQKQLECCTITKMIVNLIKFYNARRFAQRLYNFSFRAKRMSQTQEGKLKSKLETEKNEYQAIINQEQQIYFKYQLQLQNNQLNNLPILSFLKEMQEERVLVDQKLSDFQNQIKGKNLPKLKKPLFLKEHLQFVVERLSKLEFIEGKIFNFLNSPQPQEKK